MTIPVKACDILVTGNVLALQTLDAMFRHFNQSIPRLVYTVLYPDCAVPTATCQNILLLISGTDEHFNIVALHHSGLLLEYLFCSD